MNSKFDLLKYPVLSNEKRKDLIADSADSSIAEFKSYLKDLIKQNIKYDIYYNIMKNISANYYQQAYSSAFNDVFSSFYFKNENLDLFYYIVSRDNRPFDRLIESVYFHVIHQCGPAEVLNRLKTISEKSFKPYYQCLQDLLQKYSSQAQDLKAMLILDTLSFKSKGEFVQWVLLEGTYTSKSAMNHLLSDHEVRQGLKNSLADDSSEIYQGILSGARTYYILTQNDFLGIVIDNYLENKTLADFIYNEALVKKDAHSMYQFAKSISPKKILKDLIEIGESGFAKELIKAFSNHPEIKKIAILA